MYIYTYIERVIQITNSWLRVSKILRILKIKINVYFKPLGIRVNCYTAKTETEIDT